MREETKKEKNEMKLNQSTLDRAINIAELENVELSEDNSIEYFQKALIEEINLAADIVEDCRHEFGKGYCIQQKMKNRVYGWQQEDIL